ncbi:MAG: protein kinase, partial [Polyangiaceae bacterium]
ASGGMGAVHLGRSLGSAGFSRIVAIKRLHAHLASEPSAVAAFTDEARLSARVRHPNVVATLDVVEHDRELLLVMDYVHGVALAALTRDAKSADTKVPVGVAVAIALDVLGGLQAIHEATSEDGAPLSIVHRDVSPQNILVGADGVARVVDFGIAKAAVRLQNTTNEGNIKGKLRYMAPEQIMNHEVDPRTDAFAATVVLWELLTGSALFQASNDGAIVARILEGSIAPPSRITSSVSAELESVVMRGLSRKPEARFASCAEMAIALRAANPPASAAEVSAWVTSLAGDTLRERAARVAEIETGVAGDAQKPVDPEAPTVTASNIGALVAATIPPPKTWRIAVVIGAVGLLALGAIALGIAAPWRPTPPSVVPDVVAPTSVAEAPSAAPGVQPTPSAITSAAPIPSTIPHGNHATRPKVQPPRTGTRPKCNPMFTLDENGIRRVKPECL